MKDQRGLFGFTLFVKHQVFWSHTSELFVWVSLFLYRHIYIYFTFLHLGITKKHRL